MNSYLIHHEQCPECKKLGKDNGRNNLGIFSDSHKYCFSCGYTMSKDSIRSFKEKEIGNVRDIQSTLFLPTDVISTLPRIGKEWLESYGLTQANITRHSILWSESKQQVIFPYFIKGELVGYQGRCFNVEEKKKRKWFSQGKLDTFVYTIGKQSKTLYLVESIVSAIKLSSLIHVSPLFGSIVSASRCNAISHFYENVVLWLDPDKKQEAIKQANRVRLFVPNCNVILSEKKPKDHTYEEIKEYLNG